MVSYTRDRYLFGKRGIYFIYLSVTAVVAQYCFIHADVKDVINNVSDTQ